MNVAAVYTALLPQVRRAGRWLIRRLVQWGLPRVIAFLEMRIDTIRDRRARLKARKAGADTKGRKRRLRWMAWRVRWRMRLLAWLKAKKKQLRAAILRRVNAAYDKAFERIPWDHPLERYQTWAAKHG